MKKKIAIYATRAERFLSFLIDVLLIIIPLRFIAILFIETNGSGEPSLHPFFLMVMFLYIACYYTCFVASRWQATPGQRIVGIYVIRTDNHRIGIGKALERFLIFFTPLLPFYVSFLSPALAELIVMMLLIYWFAPILYTQEHVGVHDRLCRTRVMIGKVG